MYKREDNLPRVAVGNAIFLVDHTAQELREVGYPANRIPFERLKPDPATDGITLIFDRLTRNLYNGYMPENGLPPLTQKLSFPLCLLIGKAPEQQTQQASTGVTNERTNASRAKQYNSFVSAEQFRQRQKRSPRRTI